MSQPKYDIELILREENEAKMVLQLSEQLTGFLSQSLHFEERAVLNVWHFDIAFGNGINDLLLNENYDILADGIKAMRIMPSERVVLFSNRVCNVLETYGICCESAHELAKIETLSPLEGNEIKEKLGEAEAPMLQEFWNEGVLLKALRLYIINNIDIFITRK